MCQDKYTQIEFTEFAKLVNWSYLSKQESYGALPCDLGTMVRKGTLKVFNGKKCNSSFCNYHINNNSYITHIRGQKHILDGIETCRKNAMVVKKPEHFIVPSSLMAKITHNITVINKILECSSITQTPIDTDMIQTHVHDLEYLKRELR